jgi:hypothetical protein
MFHSTIYRPHIDCDQKGTAMQAPDERSEITRSQNGKEAETIEANKVVSKTDQQARKAALNPARSTGNIEEALQDREARDRMADEGNPIPKP